MDPPQAPAMKKHHPYFWVRRDRDTFVPLIPLDELPDSIRLRDVSVTKSWEDICQGEMRFLGDHCDHTGKYYVVDLLDQPPDADDHANSSEPRILATAEAGKDVFLAQEEKTDESQGPQEDQTMIGGVKQHNDRVQADIDKITSSQKGSSDSSRDGSQVPTSRFAGNPGTLGKKVYCTYWIRTGNCNYMQEGCKYKHEIPPDDDTRLAIGVRTYPTWQREDPVELPRPVKTSEVQKPALQQSWRRQDHRGPRPETSAPENSSQRPVPPQGLTNDGDNPQTQAATPSQVLPATSSGSSTQKQPMHRATQHNDYLDTSQPTVAPNHKVQKFPHGQAGNHRYHNAEGHYQSGSTTTNLRDSARIPPVMSHAQAMTHMDTNASQRSPAYPPPVSHPVHTSNAYPHGIPSPQMNGGAFSHGTAYQHNQNHPTTTIHNKGNSPSSGSSSYDFVPKSSDPNYISNPTFSAGEAPRDLNLPHYTNTDTRAANRRVNGTVAPTDIRHGKLPDRTLYTPTNSDAYPRSPFGRFDNKAGNNGYANTAFRANTPLTANTSRFSHLRGNAPSFPDTSGPIMAPIGTRPSSRILSTTTAPQDISANTDGSSDGEVTVKSSASTQDRSKGSSSSNPFSPPVQHRRMFRKPGEAEYVTNEPEKVQKKKSSPGGRKHHKGNGHGNGNRNGKGHKGGPSMNKADNHAQPRVEDLLV